MSADNGIYILQTPGTINDEYRVVHTTNIEDYQYDHDTGRFSVDYKVHIKNARKIWANSIVHITRTGALHEADKIYRDIMNSDFPVLEYGISFIEIPIKF